MKNRLVEKINKFGRKIVLPLAALSIAIAPLYAQSNDQKHFYELNDEKIHGSHNFKDNEEIEFWGHDPNWRVGDEVKWELYGPGGLVDTFKYKIMYDKENNIVIYSTSKAGGANEMSIMMDSPYGGDGNYSAVWSTRHNNDSKDWQKDGEDDFTVSH